MLLLICFIIMIGCKSSENTTMQEKSASADSIQIIDMPTKPSPITIKENSTFVGAVIDSVYLIDSLNYYFVVLLQTAIPERSEESLIEPGQVITVYPGFILGEDKKVIKNNPINKKLIDMRTLKKRGYFIGRISLSNDYKWYITNVEVYQNPPEGMNNEF